jgi:hypothetical protein
MAEDAKSPVNGLHRLRARWLAPSPPLAVDDEPQWSPLPDPADEEADSEREKERPAAASTTP